MAERELSRAEFLRLAGACGLGIGIAGFARADAGEQPAAAADPAIRLIEESFVIDGFVNPYPPMQNAWPQNPGEIKRLAGIDATAWAFGSPDNLQRISALLASGQALQRIDKSADLVAAKAASRLGILLYAQRDFSLGGSIEPLARWHADGLRVLQPAYRGEGELGGGSDRDEAPLTPLGRQAVAELNRLGIVVDVSDCGRRTTLDVAGLSKHPITANHTAAAALGADRRNKSDEELTAIAATGGVVGVTSAGRFLRPSGAPNERTSLDRYVAQLDHIIQRVGVDHVGVATEGFIDGSDVYPDDQTDPLLDGSGRWTDVARALTRRGYERADVQKVLGLNFLRVYQKVLG
jgi:membrane dipeptidase